MKEKSNLCKLIAISGLKGSGKNEVSNMFQYCLNVPKPFRQYWLYKRIRKIVPNKWKIVAFADPLKKSLSDILNIPVCNFNNRTFKEKYFIDFDDLSVSKNANHETLSDSKFSKIAKVLDPTINQYSLTIRQLLQAYGTEWMQSLFGKSIWINSTIKHCTKNTIISDLRFKEEAKAVQESNGIIIYVSRPNICFGNHASEKEMYDMLNNDTYSYIIDNDSTLEDLFYKVKDISWNLEKLL